MYNRRYPINLSSSMAVCDANYIRILKLLPATTLGTSREISLPALGRYSAVDAYLVSIRVAESFKYTSTISIQLILPDKASPYYQAPAMLVRLYHDASTAEVVSYQEQGAFHIRAHPGVGPEFSSDEKQQVNAFLADWLILCMEHGLGRHKISAQDPDAEQLMPLV